ncbi:thymidylate kinase [Arthrobacter sp. B3I4]|uniref:dTMP kinase n=1 Tax=Arthrobacter sp. B3I4 TaxID=3042267 RepID=UPI002789E02A|nr:thymidylate kinase [Arthrobacter sp. B3I4]MDQ0757327.1 dTMP kinase [Arthrobacter sp. B3I4]
MNAPLVHSVATIDTSAYPRPARRRRALIIVLAGIDGAGKSTAGRLLARQLDAAGRPAIYTMNPCGRSRMIAWSDRLGLKVPSSLQDVAETTIRCVNVLVSQLRAAYFPGIVIMDRYLYCQLALKRVKGLSPGQLLPWLLRLLPRPDVVFYFDVPAHLALTRIFKRATDTEDLETLEDFDKGYRELDDFPSFVRIDAGQSPEQIVEDLWRELVATGRVPRS